jgi:hypothetical protein
VVVVALLAPDKVTVAPAKATPFNVMLPDIEYSLTGALESLLLFPPPLYKSQ